MQIRERSFVAEFMACKSQRKKAYLEQECHRLKKLKWDVIWCDLREEYKCAIDRQKELEELTILADGIGGENDQFDYSKSYLPMCHTLSICCYPRNSSWDDHFFTWNHSEEINSDQLLDQNPLLFHFGSQYPLGIRVYLCSDQFSTASERRFHYQGTARDRQDLAFQFSSIIQNAEAKLKRNTESCRGSLWAPDTRYAPCNVEILLILKSIPIWLFVTDVTLQDCRHGRKADKVKLMFSRVEAFRVLRSQLMASFTQNKAMHQDECVMRIKAVCNRVLDTTPKDAKLEQSFLSLTKIPYRLFDVEALQSACGHLSDQATNGGSPVSQLMLKMGLYDHLRQIAHNLLNDAEIYNCVASLYLSKVTVCQNSWNL